MREYSVGYKYAKYYAKEILGYAGFTDLNPSGVTEEFGRKLGYDTSLFDSNKPKEKIIELIKKINDDFLILLPDTLSSSYDLNKLSKKYDVSPSNTRIIHIYQHTLKLKKEPVMWR